MNPDRRIYNVSLSQGDAQDRKEELLVSFPGHKFMIHKRTIRAERCASWCWVVVGPRLA